MSRPQVALYPLFSGGVEMIVNAYSLGQVSISTNMTPWQVADLLRAIADELPRRDGDTDEGSADDHG